MKQVKLLIAVMAVVFSVNSAFTQHAKFANTLFSYVSGDLTNPTSYRLTTASCPNGSAHLCTIRLANDGAPIPHPDNTALDQLVSASNNLTVAGTYATGVVKLKP